MIERFWDWTLDHPWQFVTTWTTVNLVIVALLLWAGWLAIAIGWGIGGIGTSVPRFVIQNVRFWAERKARNAYWQGRMDADHDHIKEHVAQLYQRKVGSA